jgi:ubiquinone/menaquinone biosynthesis C-methylase UbiE
MAKFHFVEDYNNLVKQLIKDHPLDEAMSIAIGGGYEEFGPVCADALIQSGLSSGMSVLDFGCGSGRVAHALAKKVTIEKYLGTDVVELLLKYARTKTPKNYKFIEHQELSIPTEDAEFDFAFAFSVFTHLLQAEIYIYMQDIHRVLKPQGRFLFSFLEMTQSNNWTIFLDTVAAQKNNTLPHLNMFLSRDQIEVMAKESGF